MCPNRAASLALLFAIAAAAWTFAPGPQITNYESSVDESEQPYGLYVPRDYTPERKWPLVISLHGAGSNHRLNLRRVFGLGNRPGESDAQAGRLFPPFPNVPMIVATPFARGTMGYQTIAEQDVYDVRADVRKRFNIDEDRVYLTGISMGGGGALWFGMTRPDLWAAIAAVCPALPEGVEARARNGQHIPIGLFQGALDPLVPAIATRALHKRLEGAGVPASYTEYPGIRHNAWDPAYANAAIFRWFEQHRRVRSPERVRFRTDAYKYSSAYWLRMDQLTPGSWAEFDGTLKDGVLKASTSGLDAFTVEARVTAAEVDGTTVRVRRRSGGNALSFQRTAKGWALGKPRAAATAKRAGLEGPIADAISTGHVYVHGAGEWENATLAADWSTQNSRPNVTFRVLRDTQIEAADLANTNVVAFGTKETNRVIEAHSTELPMHLNPGAADYGLLYVYPVNGRYLVVSSGLPWWTRHDQVQIGGLSFLGVRYRLLLSFGDYVLFKGGIDNVIAAGRFDRNWKLPPEALAKLRASGAVHLN